MKLLVLSPVYPDAPRDGDRVRLWHWLEALKKKHDVHLIAFGDGAGQVPQGAWERRLAAGLRLFSGLPVSVTSASSAAMRDAVDAAIATAEAAGRPFDACFCYRLKMAPYALRFRGPRMLDYTDSLTRYAERRSAALRLEGRGLAARWWKRQAEQTAAYEAWVAGQFDAGVFNSKQDCAAVQAMAPAFAKRLQVAANGVAMPKSDVRRAMGGIRPASPVISFVGHLAYAPNAEAVRWFALEVLPLIRAQRPDAEFHVIGGEAPGWLLGLDAVPGLRLLGPVKDVGLALARSAVSVCPVRTGAGRQNKLLEAFAARVPAVATRFSADGAEAVNGRHLLVADEAPAFAEAVLRLLAQPTLGRRLAAQARGLVGRLYRWPANAAILERALVQASRKALW